MEYIKKADREEPMKIGKAKNIYQLFVKSRSIKWLLKNQIFKGLEVRKLMIDGISIPKRENEVINLKGNSFKFAFQKQHNKQFRFGRYNDYVRGDNIDLDELYNELCNYNPRTLFIKEIELCDPSKMIVLLFRGNLMKDLKIKERIEKSLDTHSSPLFLQRIYDLPTIQQIRKDYFPKRKTTTILKTFLSKENVIKFKIVENGKK